MTLHEIAQQARIGVLAEVEDGAKRLLLTPALGNGTERVVRALGDALTAYEALVRSAHLSSSEQYAFRDLQRDEKRSYESAKHMLGQLHTLYIATMAKDD